jgi:hypothetical protein
MSVIIPELIALTRGNAFHRGYIYTDTVITLTVKDDIYYIVVKYLTTDNVMEFNTSIKSINNMLNISYVSDDYIALENLTNRVLIIFDRTTETTKNINVNSSNDVVRISYILNETIYFRTTFFGMYQYDLNTDILEICFKVTDGFIHEDYYLYDSVVVNYIEQNNKYLFIDGDHVNIGKLDPGRRDEEKILCKMFGNYNMIYKKTIVTEIVIENFTRCQKSYVLILKNYKTNIEHELLIDFPVDCHIIILTATESRWGIFFTVLVENIQDETSRTLVYYIKKDNTQKSARN